MSFWFFGTGAFMKWLYIDKKILLLLSVILILGIGIFYFSYTFTVSDLKKELLEKTEIVHSSINTDDIKTLTGTASDYLLPEYQRLLKQLTQNLERFDFGHKNLYVMTETADHDIIFIIDLERTALTHEVISLSSVGEIYHETEYIRKNIYDNPEPAPFVEGPFQDKFGIWISAIVPITDTDSGEVLAIVGIDYISTQWKWTIARKMFYPVSLFILLFFLVVLAYKISKTHQIILQRAERIKRQRDVLTEISTTDTILDTGFDDTIAQLIKILTQTLHADEGSIWFLSPDLISFTCQSVYSVDHAYYQNEASLKISEYSYVIAHLNHSHILCIDDVSKSALLTEFFTKSRVGPPPKSAIFVTIRNHRQTIGILAIATFAQSRNWQSDEESFAQTIASIMGGVLSQQDRDIAQKELQASNQRFEDTLESITDGFIYFDQERHIKYINHHTFTVLGFELSVLGSDDVWEKLPTDISELLQLLIDTAITSNTHVEHTEYVIRLDKWIEFRVYLTINDVSVFFSDVTKKKESERTILENQRLQAIEEMANGFAHDFNNYLQVILSNVEVLNKKLLLHTETYEYLNKILLTSKDAMTRVQILERFAGTKNRDSEYERVDVNQLINEAILQSTAIWKIVPEKEGIHYQINKNLEEVPDILGNDSELRSVLYNLIKNSVEAMPSGGQISITTGTCTSGVFIRVSDTGEGMTPKTAKRAFEPFYTTRSFEAGKGLGLCSVYNIISEHAGTVHVLYTKIGEGTTIEIILPLHEFQKSVGEDDTLQKPKPKILWVDDDDFIRQIGKEMFEIMGYSISVADGGDQALAMLEHEHFDILLSDIGMPKMNGWQLMKVVDERYPSRYKRVLISGWGDQYSNDQRKLHKIDKIITKPVKIQQLQKLMKDIW